MKVSVIIPFYRELPLISRAVESVLANIEPQSSVEVFICNDGAVTEQEIRARLGEAANRVSTVLFNSHAKGPGGARNTGLDAVSGDYIAFLDADDFWLPGKVQTQLAAIAKGATFVVTAYRFNAGETVIVPPRSIDKALDIFLRRGIGTSTVMITRELLGYFRFKDIRFAQDIDYWYALARSPRFRYAAIQKCFAEYSTGGSTKNKWAQLYYLHIVLRINNIGWINRARVFLSYIFSGAYNHYIKSIIQKSRRAITRV
jgi:teichuronic acid biosynthesis glycosyltransferase TuaG